jgi:hypothetical protein
MKDQNSGSKRIGFFIQPVLSEIKAVKDKFPLWVSTPNSVELDELIDRNNKFIESRIESTRTLLSKQGIDFKVLDTSMYPLNSITILGEFDFEKNNEKSWDLQSVESETSK